MGLKVSPGALHPRRIVMRSTGAGRRIVIRPSASGGSGGGVTDHGALTGLGDDDHPQYALADGTRGAFATTAQGDLADTAVQPSALSDAITAHTAATDPHGDRAYTDAQIIASLANFVAGAPGILDTWLEMVTAIQADQTGLAALTTVVAGKLAKASNLSDLADIPTARTNLGLGSAATTAASAYDAAGAAAAAQAAAIAAAATDATAKADAKVADAINDGTTTVAPSQNAVFDALAAKAPLASPTFTGTVTVPDASFSLAKLANISTARILGRRTASSGPIEEMTLPQVASDLGLTPIWTLIEERTLGANSSLETFSSLTAYKQFRLTMELRSTYTLQSGDELLMRVNGDTGSTKYSYTRQGSFDATAISAAGSQNAAFMIVAQGATAQTSTDKRTLAQILVNQKTGGRAAVLCEYVTQQDASTLRGQAGGTWKDSTAISSLSVYFNSGQIASGAMLRLEGRA